MFAYYHSHGATLHCVINMDLDTTPHYHIITNIGAILHSVINMDLDMAPCSYIMPHMEPYYTP